MRLMHGLALGGTAIASAAVLLFSFRSPGEDTSNSINRPNAPDLRTGSEVELERPPYRSRAFETGGNPLVQEPNSVADRSNPEVPIAIVSMLSSAPSQSELAEKYSYEQLLLNVGTNYEIDAVGDNEPAYRWAGSVDQQGKKSGQWMRWQGDTMDALKHFHHGKVIGPYVTFHSNGVIASYSPQLDDSGNRQGLTYLWRANGTLEAVVAYAGNAKTGSQVSVDEAGKIVLWSLASD